MMQFLTLKAVANKRKSRCKTATAKCVRGKFLKRNRMKHFFNNRKDPLLKDSWEVLFDLSNLWKRDRIYIFSITFKLERGIVPQLGINWVYKKKKQIDEGANHYSHKKSGKFLNLFNNLCWSKTKMNFVDIQIQIYWKFP